jgi:Xaa-Pro aminopeptidase
MDDYVVKMNNFCKVSEFSLFFKSDKVAEKSIEYFTGVSSDYAILILSKRKKILYVSSLEKKPVLKGVVVKSLDFKELFLDIKKINPKKIGLSYSELSAKALIFFKKEFKKILKKIKVVDIGDEVLKLRSVKSLDEIKTIKTAVRITENILSKCISSFTKFKKEKDVVDFLYAECMRENVDVSFKPIVASGAHSSNPHYFPNSTDKLKKGFCIIDFGVKYNRYCSDLTRTIYLGKASVKEKHDYNLILSELNIVENCIKCGTDKIKTSFEMVHSLGHGIGLDVHEKPFFNKDKFQSNMVIAVEPARYFKKYGIRIEDDYLVTEKGLVKLSSLSRELIEIKLNTK